MKKRFWFAGMFLLLLFGSFQMANAQCGASLSSCKTCHEVKRALPVTTNGNWHKDHSFGDFCEFCHGGNTASMNKAEAHEGVIAIPVQNPSNTCSSCHPDDYIDRAEKYAKTLNITIDDSAPSESVAQSSTETNGSQASTSDNTAPTQVATAPVKEASAISAPTDGEVIDFNELLNEPKDEQHRNIGNLILIFGILGLSVVFLGMYWNFNRDRFTAKLKAISDEPPVPDNTDFSDTTPENFDSEVFEVLEHQPSLKRLLYQLKDADPVVIEALVSITSQNGDSEELIKSLGRLDLQLLKKMQSLRDGELEVLLTLAKKM